MLFNRFFIQLIEKWESAGRSHRSDLRSLLKREEHGLFNLTKKLRKGVIQRLITGELFNREGEASSGTGAVFILCSICCWRGGPKPQEIPPENPVSSRRAAGGAVNVHLSHCRLLQANDLRAVWRRSLEGLLLLKHLDLSCNKIPSIEEHAFEPLPFLQLINLGGNLITQIRDGTFQAWHGMQFLQKLILSHNPLSVIADTSFFKLPSVKYLDLGATQVAQQTLLTLLLTTARLETLTLPTDLACCFCQEKHTSETLCRTTKFHCENVCPASAPQCARTDPLAETQRGITEAVKSRKLNASTVLNLKPKEPSLRDHETATPEVVLSLTGTDSDLGDPNDHSSRTNSYSPQHLSGQEGKPSKVLMLMLHSIQHMGWTSDNEVRKLYFLAKALVAKLKNKLHKAKSIVTMKNTISPLPAPTTQKDEVHEIPAGEGDTSTGWVQKQHGLGLNQAALNPWETAGRLNLTDNVSLFRHHKISAPPSEHSASHSPAEAPHSSASFKNQNHSDAAEPMKETHGMESVQDVEDAGEAPSPRQDYVWAYKKHQQGDSPYLNESYRLVYQTSGSVSPEEEPTPTEGKAEQRPRTHQRFFYNLLVSNSLPSASSILEDTAEEGDSSLDGRLPAVPRSAGTPWKQQKEGSSVLNKPGSSHSPDAAPV
ncbi:uncharacterized protein LOC142364257 [Opisthocomus hoazin]|uniref:uncharacterized protein LOC142364257 n=1 Tax=Opisthocomus hoazin TaxID=30419 RepID=UPI003F53B7E3